MTRQTDHTIETDYLVIGSGATGMAFADVLLTETKTSIVIVDQRDKPGGHWNDAYPYVRLHHPSAYYGVNSRHLGMDRTCTTGVNKGLAETATATEILSYFEAVMDEQFLPSGRVKYFPMCDYQGNNQFSSRVTGEHFQVKVRKKIVDTTYSKIEVPSTRPPHYHIEAGVRCIPPNGLPSIAQRPSAYVVIGSGKTGIDACIWLLEKGVEPDNIKWIMPRDAWFFDRRTIQVGPEYFWDTVGGTASLLEAIIAAKSVADLFVKLEECGHLLRLDQSLQPTSFRCAAVSKEELRRLRHIKNIVRMGHVQRIEKDQLILDQGSLPVDSNHLYIDCSANGIRRSATRPIFEGDTIIPQIVTTCLFTFSAAFIAHVEASYQDETKKNDICKVVPIPDTDVDWLRMAEVYFHNISHWLKNKELKKWVQDSRLGILSPFLKRVKIFEFKKVMTLIRISRMTVEAIPKLQQLIAQSERDLSSNSR